MFICGNFAVLILPVCDSNIRLSQFRVSSKKSCKANEPTTFTQSCSGQFFNPLIKTIDVPAFACSLVTYKWQGIEFFFGSKVGKTFDPVYTPVESSRCRNLIHKGKDDILGELFDQGDGNFATNNKLVPSYHWPTKSVSIAQNIILINTSINYDHIHEKLFSPLEELKHCDISIGSCQTVRYTFLWEWNEKQLCPNYLDMSNATSHDITLHFHLLDKTDNSSNLKLSYMEIPKLGLTFFSQVTCPILTNTCFGVKKAMCVISGDFILLDNCTEALGLSYFKRDVLNTATKKKTERFL